MVILVGVRRGRLAQCKAALDRWNTTTVHYCQRNVDFFFLEFLSVQHIHDHKTRKLEKAVLHITLANKGAY